MNQIVIRAALNVGEVHVEKKDIFGSAVNLAARVESITPAGDIYFSQAVHWSMNQAEVDAEPVGKKSFKGFDTEVEIYRVKPKNDDGTAPPFGSDFTILGANADFHGMGGISESAKKLSSKTKPILIGLGILAAVAAGGAGIYVYLDQPNFRQPITTTTTGSQNTATQQTTNTTTIMSSGLDKGDLKEAVKDAFKQNNLAQATALAREFTASYPTEPDTYLYSGHLLIAEGRWEEAVQSYRQAIQLRSKLINDKGLVDRLISNIGKHPDIANFVAENASDKLISKLTKQAAKPGWNERHGAVAALQASNNEAKIDWVQFHTLNLNESKDCQKTLESVNQLKTLNASSALPQLEALKTKSNGKPSESCYQEALDQTISELKG